jgi:hypothetical protein
MNVIKSGIEKLLENIAELIKVKTYVTVVIVTVFAVLVLRGIDVPNYFQNLLYGIICFYFGTQYEQKNQDIGE